MQDRTLGYAGALGWMSLAIFGLWASLVAMVQLRPAARTDIVTLGAVEAAVLLVFTLGVVSLHARERSLRDALALRPTHPALPVLGLALGSTLQVPAEALRVLVERRFPTPDDELALRAVLLHAGSPLRLALLLIVAACVVPLVEEVFFRGAIFTALRRGPGIVAAALLSAFGFVVCHMDLRAWPALLLVALVMSFLRAVSGSLLPPLALHVGFNAVSIVALETGVASIGRPMGLGPLATLGGFGLSLALLLLANYVARGSEEAEQARIEDAE